MNDTDSLSGSMSFSIILPVKRGAVMSSEITKNPIPENAAKLLLYNPDLLHIDFEAVHDPDEDFNDWFDTEGKDYSANLYQIGVDGTGGIFALWDKDGFKTGKDPLVVYLGSDGEAAVAAKTLDDFLQLLTVEHVLYDLIVDGEKIHYTEIIDDDLLPEVKRTQTLYLSWLNDVCGIAKNKNAEEILVDASKHLEDFEAWCDERIGE
jgi:hypothetical protein